MRIGCFLSSEEHGPQALADQARRAQGAGFHALWISDHYHPWIDEQRPRGRPPFVLRPNPRYGLGDDRRDLAGLQPSGDHRGDVPDGARPPGGRRPRRGHERRAARGSLRARRRQRGGAQRAHPRHGLAGRLYDLPDDPPPIYVSGFGPKAVQLAARIGDGYVTTMPDRELIGLYRSQGGKGPVQAGTKVCFGHDEAAARRTAHRLWPNEGLPGELAQVLPSTAHFEQASELVSEEMVAAFDEWAREVLPRFEREPTLRSGS